MPDMKQLYKIFLFDLRMNMKSVMGVYMLGVPLIILLVLRSFLPAVDDASVTIAAVTEGPYAVDAGLLSELDRYADIPGYDSIEKMENKLRGAGSAEGLYYDPEAGQYVSVLERNVANNQKFSVSSRIIRRYLYEKQNPGAGSIIDYKYGVPPELSDRPAISPVASMGGSIFMIFIVVICGFVVGLGVVNDKEEGTIRALHVSPVSKSDYYIGKCVQPLILVLVYSILNCLILGLMDVKIGQVYFTALLAFPVALLYGLLIGALGRNETEAMAIGKMLSMLMMLSVLGSTLIPETWRWTVWWSPFYWIYSSFEGIFTMEAVWSVLARNSGIVLGLTLAYFMLFRRRILKGL